MSTSKHNSYVPMNGTNQKQRLAIGARHFTDALERGALDLVPEAFVGSCAFMHTLPEDALDSGKTGPNWRRLGREIIAEITAEEGGAAVEGRVFPWVVTGTYAVAPRPILGAAHATAICQTTFSDVRAKWLREREEEFAFPLSGSDDLFDKYQKTLKADGSFNELVGGYQRYLTSTTHTGRCILLKYSSLLGPSLSDDYQEMIKDADQCGRRVDLGFEYRKLADYYEHCINPDIEQMLYTDLLYHLNDLHDSLTGSVVPSEVKIAVTLDSYPEGLLARGLLRSLRVRELIAMVTAAAIFWRLVRDVVLVGDQASTMTAQSFRKVWQRRHDVFEYTYFGRHTISRRLVTIGPEAMWFASRLEGYDEVYYY